MASAAGRVTIVCSGRQLQQVAAPPVLRRRSANYQPNTWDYDSICSLQQQEGNDASGHGDIKPNKQNSLQTTLKDRVRQLLLKEEEDLPTRLRIIDQLQSLGVVYHFEEEIKSILMCMHVEDVFSAFRDDKGGFKAANPKDVDGFIALYEASYLAFPGEAMLDAGRACSLISSTWRGSATASTTTGTASPRPATTGNNWSGTCSSVLSYTCHRNNLPFKPDHHVYWHVHFKEQIKKNSRS